MKDCSRQASLLLTCWKHGKKQKEAMEMVLETERLILREMDEGDLPDLAEMLENPRVMAAYEHTFTAADICQWLARQQGRYQAYGFGLWAVVEKGGRMVGQAGLSMQPYRGREVLEIGYLLKERLWGRGFAREAAAGCKRYAFETLGRDAVYSIIKSDNIRSVRVAEGIGMKRLDTFVTRYYAGDMLHFLYRVERA